MEFITKTAGKKVSLFGYDASFNDNLSQVATPGCTYKLDDIWEHISEPIVEKQEGEEDGKKKSEAKKSPKMKITNGSFNPTP